MPAEGPLTGQPGDPHSPEEPLPRVTPAIWSICEPSIRERGRLRHDERRLGRFAGAAVIVTSGGHGIGRACAARLAVEGAQIAVADPDQTAAQQVASCLTHTDRGHLAVWLDMTDMSSVEQAFADAASELGGIDVLINVAGGDTHHGTFEETTDSVWAQMIELNLLGVVRCCRADPHCGAAEESRDRQRQLH